MSAVEAVRSTESVTPLTSAEELPFRFPRAWSTTDESLDVALRVRSSCSCHDLPASLSFLSHAMSSSSSTSELHSADAEPSYSGGNLSLSWERGNETARSQQVNKGESAWIRAGVYEADPHFSAALENRGIAAAFSSSDDDGYGEDDSEMQGESEECSSEWEAPRKKVKVAKKQRRSKTGKAVVKPGLLSILPLELFTEVSRHVALQVWSSWLTPLATDLCSFSAGRPSRPLAHLHDFPLAAQLARKFGGDLASGSSRGGAS